MNLGHITPLLNKLSVLHNFTIESQVQFHAPLAFEPRHVQHEGTDLHGLTQEDLAVFVNSAYSFYWDVARDWDLHLFSSPRERDNPEYPWGLRRHRWFHAKEFYYAAIIIDAMLRCTWSFKLSPHLDHFHDLEGGIFLMEALEVLRRWICIFFRVECEWGKYTYS